MIDPATVCLFIPPELKKFKLDLFNRIGAAIEAKGGSVVRGNVAALAMLPRNVIPIVGCTPALKPHIDGWRRLRRPFIYWDRGYWLRVFATWLPRGENGGMYRWHLNAFQLPRVEERPDDRLSARRPPLAPWRKAGRHIVVAHPTATYARFHGLEDWTGRTVEALARVTDRQIVVRDKESKRPLGADLDGAHALVAHGSNAAVEAVIMGCPVVVHQDSAAAHVGLTDLGRIEQPVMPDREPWLRALAYSQFDENELTNGVLWKLIS
jgi:hypothetical protein